MAKLTSNYANYATHKFIVDLLEQDGVICNSGTKTYDEQGTYEGGSGFRLSFTKYNNKIRDYHTILKVLTGEQRANITEAIPTIDYLDNTNTSLLYTYKIDESTGSKRVDPTSIYAAPKGVNNALSLIDSEDKFFINRAIMGEAPAEHFYNTTGTPSEVNIQVSPWLGQDHIEYIYRGITPSAFYVGSTKIESATIQCEIQSIDVEEAESDNIIQNRYIQIQKDTLSVKGTVSEVKLLNKLGVIDVDYDEAINYKVSGVTFITHPEDNNTQYLIKLRPQDVCLLIPNRDNTATGYKLFVFKYQDNSEGQVTNILTWGPYKIPNPDYDANDSSSPQYIEVKDCIKDLRDIPAGTVYYLRDYPGNAEPIEDTGNLEAIPETLLAEAEIVSTSDISNSVGNIESYWALKDAKYKAYMFRVATATSSEAMLTTRADNPIPEYLRRTGIYNIVRSFVTIENIYVAQASGLLDGLYEEPYKRSIAGDINTVTSWKFINDAIEASKKGVSIPVGTRYYKGHLLNRGTFNNAPLRLTSKDYENTTAEVDDKVIKGATRLDNGEIYEYKGKLTLAYDKLVNASGTLFDKYKVNNFTNFNLRALENVVTLNTLRDNSIGQAATTSLIYPSKFKEVFEAQESKPQQSIYQYIENSLQALKDNNDGTYTLNIDLTDTQGDSVYARTTKQATHTTITENTMVQTGEDKVGLFTYAPHYESKEVQRVIDGESINEAGTADLGRIYTEYSKNVAVKYTVTLGDISINQGNSIITDESTKRKEGVDISDIKIKLLSPYEALSPKGTTITIKDELSNNTREVPQGAYLVYPDYSDNLPNTLILMSRENLGLEEYKEDGTKTSQRSMISLLDDNSVISFKVSKIRKYQPSKIKQVYLKTPDQTITLSYPKGLYSTSIDRVSKIITGFKEVDYKINTAESGGGFNVTYTDGDESYNLGSLIGGDYALGDCRRKFRARLNESTGEYTPIESYAMTAVPQPVMLAANTVKNSDTDFEPGSSELKAKRDNNKDIIESSQKSKKIKNTDNSLEALINQVRDNFIVDNLEELDEVTSKDIQSSSRRVKRRTPGVANSTVAISTDMSRSGLVALISAEIDPTSGGIILGLRLRVPTYSIIMDEVEVSTGTLYDCYIYFLSPLELSLDNIKLYDQDDKPIGISISEPLCVTPMSWPSNYFKVNVKHNRDKSITNELVNKNDVDTLKNKKIIPGLPRFQSRADLERADVGGLNFRPIINMIYGESSSPNNSIKSILSNTCYDIFKNFKLSGLEDQTGTQNPLLMSEFPDLVDGLTQMRPVLNDLVRAGFDIPINDTTYKITDLDVQGLLGRIDTKSPYYSTEYEVITDTSKNNDGWKDKVGKEGYDEAFSEELANRIKNITFRPKEGTTNILKERPSLKEMRDDISKALVSSGNLTRELCEKIDGYFGNNTKAFLSLGNPTAIALKGDKQILMSDVLIQEASKLDKAIVDVIYDMITQARLKAIGANTVQENLKAIYLDYYTADSVNVVFGTSVDYETLNDSEGLKIDFECIKNGSLAAFSAPELLDAFREAKQSLKTNNPNILSKFGARLSYTLDLVVGMFSGDTESAWIRRHMLTSDDATALKALTDTEYRERQLLIDALRVIIRERTFKRASTIMGRIMGSAKYSLPTREQVRAYLGSHNSQNSEGVNYFYNVLGEKEDPNNTGAAAVNIKLTTIVPTYDPNTNILTPNDSTGVGKVIQSNAKANSYAIIPLTIYGTSITDATVTVLEAIGSFIKSALEGTGSAPYYVKYVKGDKEPQGRSNSLYYRRYLMLNNRLNTSEGTLARLMPFVRDNIYNKNIENYANNLISSYDKYMNVVPVAKMNELAWLPAQDATNTNVKLPGKFYYKSEMEALRAEISNQCILTCSRCLVQKSCPFYSEEEIVKLYCTPAEYIDLYVKDNELDLLAYTSDTDESGLVTSYPDIRTEDSDGQTQSIPTEDLKKIHTPYRDIMVKTSNTNEVTSYQGQSLKDLREELGGAGGFNDATDGESMGWLLGARYGTVQKNNMAALANKDDDFKEFGVGVKIPEYQYLYDAIYIKDTESYIDYGVSDEAYDIAFEKGPADNKKKYVGRVKIKTPRALKAFTNSNPNDHLYLVSDDNTDESGNRIVPVIYLGQLKDIRYNFNMIMDPSKSCMTAADPNIYAADIAQWCANYYKGHLTKDPINDIDSDPSNPAKDPEVDKDQYWMPTLKKKIYRRDTTTNETLEEWITLEGRPRESTGYQEAVMSTEGLDEVMVAAGKPTILNYINFLRKVSFRMYDASKVVFDDAGNLNEEQAWCIPWVKGINSTGVKTLKDGSRISWDSQKAALAYMKTNLRLVIVKDISHSSYMS